MGKVVKVAAGVVGVAALVIPGVGAAITTALVSLGVASSTAATLTLGLLTAGLSCPVAEFQTSSIIGAIRTIAAMPPRRVWHHLFRFRSVRGFGDCMDPHFPAGMYGIIDRNVPIREGDLVFLRRTDGTTLIKRFVGFEDGLVMLEANHPRSHGGLPIDTIRWCYRIRAMARDARGLMSARRAILKDEAKHNELLGRIVVRSWEGREAV